jgi:hypothetical protein
MAPISIRTTVIARRAACAVVVLFLVAPLSHAADILFIRSAAGSPSEQEAMETAAKFYGLNLDVITVNDASSLKTMVGRRDVVGVAVAANALTIENESQLRRVLRVKQDSSKPLLILGVTDQADQAALRAWTSEAVSGCKPFGPSSHAQYEFGKVDGLTAQLSELSIASVGKSASYLAVAEASAVQQIVSLRNNDRTAPVFVETTGQHAGVFVACAVSVSEDGGGYDAIVNAFLHLAPAMIFTKYAGGDLSWHAARHFANLTIDDPWLRQPYGYVDYNGLLEEMEKHNFHATIAFIPWNYQRSEPGVVALFKNHPDRYSITIHGDNHDHKEFTDYRSKPLPSQVDALKQSLARMEQFQALTGIPYDRVMVFPHSIAPRETLEELKRANYWGTVNAGNVPQGEKAPSSIGFALRPATLSFAGFPSLNRYSIAGPISSVFVAINAYLGNPILFYGHTDDFAKGVGAFNEVADGVNQLQPDTQWAGLGEIVKHLYLIRDRDDSDYDLLALSNDFCVENTTQRGLAFHVQKEEAGIDPIHSVLIDGHPAAYQIKDRQLNVSIEIPKSGKRCVAINYGEDADLSTVSPTHDSSLAYSLRMASDFRDIYLSKVPGGLAFIRFYNEHEVTPSELLGIALSLILLGISGVYALRAFVKSKRRAQIVSNTFLAKGFK